MRPGITALLSGAVFAAGLGVSGMTQPQKVVDFLDIAGAWDPSLAFVMLGAIGLNIVLFRFILRRTGPVLGGIFQLPNRRDVDARLVAGAALFGAGWGLGGYCPGPGLASFAAGRPPALVFVVTMAAGMVAQHLLMESPLRARLRAGSTQDPSLSEGQST
jgi:uncharacterized membrane protein YedE/YeeE